MNTCDDCGAHPAVVVDIADGAQLCAQCAEPYDRDFHRERLRRRLPLADRRPTIHRRQS